MTKIANNKFQHEKSRQVVYFAFKSSGDSDLINIFKCVLKNVTSSCVKKYFHMILMIKELSELDPMRWLTNSCLQAMGVIFWSNQPRPCSPVTENNIVTCCCFCQK